MGLLAAECVWNLMAHGDAREGKWRGNWWMEWVASTLTLPRNMVYPALLTLMRTPRLPAFDWIDAPANKNGLVRFGERRNLVSAPVPLRFERTLPRTMLFLVTKQQFGKSQWQIPQPWQMLQDRRETMLIAKSTNSQIRDWWLTEVKEILKTLLTYLGTG